jgi:hypothetical protein
MSPEDALAQDQALDNAQEPVIDNDPDFVEIRFSSLPGRCRIVNMMRRKLGNYVFEPGTEMAIIARSSDKDADGIPYIVVSMDRKFEYVSENDVAIDSSSLSKKERKLSALEQRTKLMELLKISYK